MSFRSLIFLVCCCPLLLIANSCGKRSADKTPEEVQREHELKLFNETIRMVQERYVDEDQVQIDHIISNSLKGMVAAIDPFAEIRFTGNPPPEVIPDDVPLVEMIDSEWREIMILNVYSFHPLMKKQLRDIESSLRDRNPAGILLDCRGATGDNYPAALEIAEMFLPRGTTIGSVVEKQGASIRTLTTRRNPLWTTNSVVVLIDQQTSGPAELLAAALKFHRRAILAGEPSRGLTVVQSPVPLTDEWIVMLSTGRITDPDGKDLTGHPLEPDIRAKQDPEDKEHLDYILQRGMTTLRDQLIDPR